MIKNEQVKCLFIIIDLLMDWFIVVQRSISLNVVKKANWRGRTFKQLSMNIWWCVMHSRSLNSRIKLTACVFTQQIHPANVLMEWQAQHSHPNTDNKNMKCYCCSLFICSKFLIFPVFMNMKLGKNIVLTPPPHLGENTWLMQKYINCFNYLRKKKNTKNWAMLIVL